MPSSLATDTGPYDSTCLVGRGYKISLRRCDDLDVLPEVAIGEHSPSPARGCVGQGPAAAPERPDGVPCQQDARERPVGAAPLARDRVPKPDVDSVTAVSHG